MVDELERILAQSGTDAVVDHLEDSVGRARLPDEPDRMLYRGFVGLEESFEVDHWRSENLQCAGSLGPRPHELFRYVGLFFEERGIEEDPAAAAAVVVVFLLGEAKRW